MLKQRLLITLIGAASFITLVFGISTGHALAASISPSMNKQMSQAQCQSSCTKQSQNTVTQNIKTEVDGKDIEPQPTEPYYLAFMGVGWTSLVTIAAAYLIKYLNWHPPDLFKLNVTYRF